MKYYQCKNQRKLYNTLFFLHTIFYGALTLIIWVDFDFCYVTGTKLERALWGLPFLGMAMVSIGAYIHRKYVGKYERTVEIAEDEIIYQEKNKTITMKWDEMSSVVLYPGFLWMPWQRIVYFTAKGPIPYMRQTKVSSKRIWSEYNDEMLEEIKKYWHGVICNEDKYLKYKNSSENERKYE